MSKGIAEEDTQTRFGVKFMQEYGHNQGKYKQSKTRSLDELETLWNGFSNEKPRERPTLGIRLIK